MDKTVRVWELSKGLCIRVIYGVSSQMCIRFHPVITYQRLQSIPFKPWNFLRLFPLYLLVIYNNLETNSVATCDQECLVYLD